MNGNNTEKEKEEKNNKMRYLTVTDASEIIGFSRSQIFNFIEDKKIQPVMKLSNGILLFEKSEVERVQNVAAQKRKLKEQLNEIANRCRPIKK